jgi:alcohol/geraniol dehydrogenase (NADP+)
MISGWAAREARARLEPYAFEPAPLGPLDVELEVTHCGLCHSDLHLIDNDWGSNAWPLVPGHEVVGTVSALGSSVTGFRVGQRVGAGWQRSACFDCDLCREGQENLCPYQTATCVRYPGGLAERLRTDSRFVFVLPDSLPSAVAAPLLCAGVTVHAPIARSGVGPGSRVGVLGIGGLGHIAVLMLRALGCEVTALTSSLAKVDDLRRMGAHEVVPSNDVKELRKHLGRFHLLLSTAPARLDWVTLLQTVRPGGTFCFVATPPGVVTLPAQLLVTQQRTVSGSDIGSRAAMVEMLRFADEYGIAPLVETRPMAEVNEAIERVRRNDARYRVVLTV